MTRTSETRVNEAALRKQAAQHPRASKQAERLLNAAEECREIAERRERNGWPR
jgi:hypothetical protein